MKFLVKYKNNETLQIVEQHPSDLNDCDIICICPDDVDHPNDVDIVEESYMDMVKHKAVLNEEKKAARIAAEIQAQIDYDNLYSTKRQKEYPSIGDQLDMLYWDKVNGTNNWQDLINSIKTKYPKN